MSLELPFDLKFSDLYNHDGLVKIQRLFLSCLSDWDVELCANLEKSYSAPDALSSKEHSDLIIKVSPYVEEFIGYLFGNYLKIESHQKTNRRILDIIHVKRQFVQRYAIKKFDGTIAPEHIATFSEMFKMSNCFDTCFAKGLLACQKHPDQPDYQQVLDSFAEYAAFATLTPEGQALHKGTILFKTPQKTDYDNLLPHLENHDGEYKIGSTSQRLRDGFNLTDKGFTIPQAQDQANYCIYCHNQGKDSCSTGLKPKDKSSKFLKNPLGVEQAGCPLDEKISEMNKVKADGYDIGALAIIIIDNSMVAATGHRICNDCMKSCIFQKQEPVNIPAVETNILQSVLDLPYGFEIYSLLTRWNPLNIRAPFPMAPTGKKILIAGMGPAGFTLAHYMMQQGHDVVGIDGLKIEPMSEKLIGDNFQAIMGLQNILADLDHRVVDGFGGVAEYGITVRWNKNYLKVIRLLLERRRQFSIFGGVRLGGTLTLNQAVEMGFDHIALCLGAGQPKLLDINGAMLKGVRAASDFLMTLHQGGAFKEDSLTNLQIRLPLIVVGGGLTAIDTATEALTYYVRQCEKLKKRYDILVNESDAQTVRKSFWAEDHAIADEMLAHAELFLNERVVARSESRLPNFAKIIDALGGVKIFYRGPLNRAPSYRLNHEEVAKALEEGIHFVENAEITEIHADVFGAVASASVTINGNAKNIPVRSILVAAGTKPNTNLYDDIPHELEMVLSDDGEPLRFQAHDANGGKVDPERCTKPDHAHILMTTIDGRAVTFFGDLHPSFSGNVVKAMASAKRGAPIIEKILMTSPVSEPNDIHKIAKDSFSARVHVVERLSDNVTAITFHAPLAAQNFKMGQFFRLQNFHKNAHQTTDTTYLMEGVALSGVAADASKGLVSTIILNLGASSEIAQNMKVGEDVLLMGPTGAPAEIPSNETVLLICGGYYNPVMAGIGQEMRGRGCKVLYLAGYKHAQDCVDLTLLEAAADQLILTTDTEPMLPTERPNDRTMVGNILEALEAYAKNQGIIQLNMVDRIVVLGSPPMLKAIQNARKTTLAPYLKPGHIMIGNVSAPMQCMMKGICSQCICQVTDPKTGDTKRVFACAHQDQDIDMLNFDSIFGRLTQQSTQEKLTKLWVAREFKNG